MPPRYVPQRHFPAYAFIPGRNAHPTRSPEGHSYRAQEAEPALTTLSHDRWRENREYLWGTDLYNHGYFWEAHEIWEGLWQSARHDNDSCQATFLRGLIQCAAACLKILMNQPQGLQKLSRRGVEQLQRVRQAAGLHYMGLELDSFIGAFLAFTKTRPDKVDNRPRLHLKPKPPP